MPLPPASYAGAGGRGGRRTPPSLGATGGGGGGRGRRGGGGSSSAAAAAAAFAGKGAGPPSHPREADPSHRKFLARSLSRNDVDLAALNKLTPTIHHVKKCIETEFGFDTLLDVANGTIRLSLDGNGLVGLPPPPAPESDAADGDDESSSSRRRDNDRLIRLCRDYLLRHKLRRRLLNRLCRRLNRVSAAMDGVPETTWKAPFMPRYGDERFVVPQELLIPKTEVEGDDGAKMGGDGDDSADEDGNERVRAVKEEWARYGRSRDALERCAERRRVQNAELLLREAASAKPDATATTTEEEEQKAKKKTEEEEEEPFVSDDEEGGEDEKMTENEGDDAAAAKMHGGDGSQPGDNNEETEEENKLAQPTAPVSSSTELAHGTDGGGRGEEPTYSPQQRELLHKHPAALDVDDARDHEILTEYDIGYDKLISVPHVAVPPASADGGATSSAGKASSVNGSADKTKERGAKSSVDSPGKTKTEGTSSSADAPASSSAAAIQPPTPSAMTTTATTTTTTTFRFTLADPTRIDPSDPATQSQMAHVRHPGIGAANRAMNSTERSQEYQRWKRDVLGHIPDQPTFDELGLGLGFVFYEKERKDMIKMRLKTKKKKEEEEAKKKKAEEAAKMKTEEEGNGEKEEEEGDESPRKKLKTAGEEEKNEPDQQESPRKKVGEKTLKKKILPSPTSTKSPPQESKKDNDNDDDDSSSDDDDEEEAVTTPAEDTDNDKGSDTEKGEAVEAEAELAATDTDKSDKVSSSAVDEMKEKEEGDGEAEGEQDKRDYDDDGDAMDADKDDIPADTQKDEEEEEEDEEMKETGEEEKAKGQDATEEAAKDAASAKKNTKATDVEEGGNDADDDDGSSSSSSDEEEEDEASSDEEEDSGEKNRKADPAGASDKVSEVSDEEEKKEDKKEDEDEEDVTPVAAPLLPPKKKRPFSLQPVPSFYEQDLRRIRLIHGDLVMTNMQEYARKRIKEATEAYNRAYRLSSDVAAEKNKKTTELNRIVINRRMVTERAKKDHNLEVAIARGLWQKRKEEWERKRLAEMRYGLPPHVSDLRGQAEVVLRCVVDRVAVRDPMSTEPSIGTPTTARVATTMASINPVKAEVAGTLGRMVDAVSVRAETTNGVAKDRFEDFVPPPPSSDPGNQVINRETGETLSQMHQRMENDLRREVTVCTARLQTAEEERKKKWRKLLKVQHDQMMESHVRGRRGHVDLHRPMPPLKGGAVAPISSFVPPPAPRHVPQKVKPRSSMATAATAAVPPMRSAVPVPPAGAAAAAAADPSAQRYGYGTKYSAENVKKRVYSDGSVMPVTRPKQNPDGLYQRPAGRKRKGMDWDATRGVWVPETDQSGGGFS